jgi:hypothetical protein
MRQHTHNDVTERANTPVAEEPMVDDTFIYEEIWPRGRMMHLRLTSHLFTTSVFNSFLPLTTIPIASIRRVAIGRLGLSKMMSISYYKDSSTFVTSSFPASNMAAWRQAFRRVGISVN